jgi:hypothetical protein
MTIPYPQSCSVYGGRGAPPRRDRRQRRKGWIEMRRITTAVTMSQPGPSRFAFATEESCATDGVCVIALES